MLVDSFLVTSLKKFSQASFQYSGNELGKAITFCGPMGGSLGHDVGYSRAFGSFNFNIWTKLWKVSVRWEISCFRASTNSSSSLNSASCSLILASSILSGEWVAWLLKMDRTRILNGTEATAKPHHTSTGTSSSLLGLMLAIEC